MAEAPTPERKRLRLFLSYAAEQFDLADSLQLSLSNAGHEVFFDRTSIPPGKDYNPFILSALRACDLVVFLISPASVRTESYTMAELRLVRDIWNSPEGHILPIMAVETPLATVPAYLKAVSILRPEGDLVAEVYAAIDTLASGWSPTQTAFGQAQLVEGALLQLTQMRRKQELETRITRLKQQWMDESRRHMVTFGTQKEEPTIFKIGFATFSLLVAMSIGGGLIVIGHSAQFGAWIIGLLLVLYGMGMLTYLWSQYYAYWAAKSVIDRKISEAQSELRLLSKSNEEWQGNDR